MGATINIWCRLRLTVWHDPSTMAAIRGSGGLKDRIRAKLFRSDEVSERMKVLRWVFDFTICALHNCHPKKRCQRHSSV
jgi:hypothetical protein